jgi:hypothetical protein
VSRGQLSDHFRGVAYKTLSQVEANVLASNQHEYNGTAALKRIFGTGQPRVLLARFIYLDDEGARITDDSSLTWYDARAQHPTRSEYRLYFPSNTVCARAHAGDAIFFAMRPDETVLVIIAPAGSTVRSQILWLFDLDEERSLDFTAREFDGSPIETGFAARLILEELGIEAEGPGEERLDALIEPFGLAFPSTREFSAFTRASLPDLAPKDDPDAVLLAWVEREEQLFRRLERRIVSGRLEAGFHEDGRIDVDGFLGFSLSVQNRRKARAGSALENHIEVVLKAFDLEFERGAGTENGNRPDFLFPGSPAYRDPAFPVERLLMLGAKTTCKDRWRQVLSEAERIPQKYLLTLEPGISASQTDEMRSKRLQLVLPASLHRTYQPAQALQLMSVREFVTLAAAVQGLGAEREPCV